MWELERASNATGILFVYFPIKKQISFKEYLYITNSKLSSVIAKLKVSAHLLFLDTRWRFEGKERNLRICPRYCDNIEDVHYFVKRKHNIFGVLNLVGHVPLRFLWVYCHLAFVGIVF